VNRSPLLLVAILVVGLAVGAAVGALLLGGDDDGGGSADSAAVELPATLGEFRDVVEVSNEKREGDADPAQSENQDKVRAVTVDAYSKAFDGAGADYRQYSDAGLERMPWVIAVRAPAPGATVGPVIDPGYLKVAKPEREIQQFGDVACELFNEITSEEQTPPPEAEHAVRCQRTGSDLTVFAVGARLRGPRRHAEDGRPDERGVVLGRRLTRL
jgi:hypothetical protein